MENELLITPYKDVTVVSFQNLSVLDSANIESLGRNLLDLIQKQDTRKLILEFTAVRFMSSQALGVLLQLKKAMDPLKGQIVIAGMVRQRGPRGGRAGAFMPADWQRSSRWLQRLRPIGARRLQRRGPPGACGRARGDP